MTAPFGSVIETIVLLNVDLMWAWPATTLRRSLRRGRREPEEAGDGALGTLAGARVRLRALAVDGQAAAVPQALVAADFDLAANVSLNLAAQVAFDLVVLVDVLLERDELVLGEVADANVRADAGGRERFRRAGAADAVDIGERDLNPLFARKIDAG